MEPESPLGKVQVGGLLIGSASSPKGEKNQ